MESSKIEYDIVFGGIEILINNYKKKELQEYIGKNTIIRNTSGNKRELAQKLVDYSINNDDIFHKLLDSFSIECINNCKSVDEYKTLMREKDIDYILSKLHENSIYYGMSKDDYIKYNINKSSTLKAIDEYCNSEEIQVNIGDIIVKHIYDYHVLKDDKYIKIVDHYYNVDEELLLRSIERCEDIKPFEGFLTINEFKAKRLRDNTKSMSVGRYNFTTGEYEAYILKPNGDVVCEN